jgi:hypothetical protein
VGQASLPAGSVHTASATPRAPERAQRVEPLLERALDEPPFSSLQLKWILFRSAHRILLDDAAIEHAIQAPVRQPDLKESPREVEVLRGVSWRAKGAG